MITIASLAALFRKSPSRSFARTASVVGLIIGGVCLAMCGLAVLAAARNLRVCYASWYARTRFAVTTGTVLSGEIRHSHRGKDKTSCSAIIRYRYDVGGQSYESDRRTYDVDTDDCEGLYKRCIDAGAESISAPEKLEHWPVTAAFVRDPDGYMVEILEHHGEAPALSGPGRDG